MITRLLALVLASCVSAGGVLEASAQAPVPVPPGKGIPDGGGLPSKPPNASPPAPVPETPVVPPPAEVPPLPTPVPPEPPVNAPPVIAGTLPDATMPTAPGLGGLIGATRPATYAERSILGFDAGFVGRVSIAAMTVIAEVLAEPDATPEHAARVKFAGRVLREQEIVTRQLARLVVSVIAVRADSRGYTATPATDAELRAAIAARWTALSRSMGQPF